MYSIPSKDDLLRMSPLVPSPSDAFWQWQIWPNTGFYRDYVISLWLYQTRWKECEQGEGEWLILLEVSSFRTLSVRLCEGLMRPAAPVFSGGRTAPIGCPRHSGVSLACEWQNQWAGKELCQGSLNISPPNLPRNYIMAPCLCWSMKRGRRRGRRSKEETSGPRWKYSIKRLTQGQQTSFTGHFTSNNCLILKCFLTL